MSKVLSFLPADASRVNEVIHDVKIRDAGVEIHYVVDPFEIANYCFPAQRIKNFSSWEEATYNVIALYEIFYGHRQPPILLDEYNYELTGNIRYWQSQAQEGLKAVELLKAETGDYRELTTSRDLSTALALAIGVLGEGFSRLKDLLTSRLASFAIQPTKDALELTRCFAETQLVPDFAVDVAVDCFNKMISNHNETSARPMTEKVRQRNRNSIMVDSQAVCRLLRVQEAAALSYEAERLSQRHLFCYVSSADRNKFLFTVLQEQKRLPFVDGRLFTVWRTPRQILLALLCKGNSLQETVGRLEKIRDIVEALRNQDQTLFDKRSLSQVQQEQFDLYQDSISKHYERVQGFGLRSLLASNSQFLDLLNQSSDTDSEQEARNVIRAHIEQTEWGERAQELVDLNLFFTEAKVLTDTLLRNLAAQTEADQLGLHFARSGRDPVAGSRHHLPTLFIVRPSGYEEEVETIKQYFLTPVHGRAGQGKLIGRACALFLEKDSIIHKLGADQIGHEFVRNLLFLVLPPIDADRFALDHAEEMVARIAVLMKRESDSAIHSSLERYNRDFQYLGCWAARRQGEYSKGDKWASRAIETYGDLPDPRFFHARCLNSYAWLSDFRTFGTTKPPAHVSITHAVDDAIKALEYYQQWDSNGVDDGSAEQIGAIYNTLSCLFVYNLDELYDVGAAREYLDQLKNHIDKSRWLNRFPEYFHTEALVEFEEFKTLRSNHSTTEELLQKLENALREINLAFNMYESSPHAKHRREVEVLRSQILDAVHECQNALAN